MRHQFNTYWNRRAIAFGALLTFAAISEPVYAGRIVINHDEWTTSEFGYTAAGGSNTDNFVGNLGEYLAGPSGKILIYSDNFGLVGTSFSASLTSRGYSVTYSTGAFDLTGYNAVFLTGWGYNKNDAALQNFVNNGGGVYISTGTEAGSPAEEAARWNSFLRLYGLDYAPSYNGYFGNNAVDSPSHALFRGVSQLYYNNGNTVNLTGTDSHTRMLDTSGTGIGFIAAYDSTMNIVSTPEPGSMLLISAGLLGVWINRRRLI